MARAFLQHRRQVVGTAASLGVAVAGCAPRHTEEAAAKHGCSGPRRPYRLDFAKMADEAALSAGGVWTNNELGTSGNRAAGNMTNMRVGLAPDGTTRIAIANHIGLVLGYLPTANEG